MRTIIRHEDDRKLAEVTCNKCHQTTTMTYDAAKRNKDKPCRKCTLTARNQAMSDNQAKRVDKYVKEHNNKENGLYLIRFTEKRQTCLARCKHCKQIFELRYRPQIFDRYGCKACTDSIRGEKTGKYQDLGITNKHRLYRIFNNMLQRTGEYVTGSSYYTDKDIKVCKEWLDDRTLFFKWALSNGYSNKLSIDRIDNNKGYSPSNCRWVTQYIQQRNTRKLCKNNTSGFRGVSIFAGNDTMYRARITVNNIEFLLGTSDSAKYCAYIYDKYIIEHNLEHTKNFTNLEFQLLNTKYNTGK